ncbi:MAG: GYD domain-containing protein [Desulfobacterales bacterium]
MATFFMFGKYSSESIRGMSLDRTQQAIEAIRELGGEVKAMHALLGEHDLLFCVELPGIDEALKASVTLNRLTGISFNTCPAVPVETFDRLVSPE